MHANRHQTTNTHHLKYNLLHSPDHQRPLIMHHLHTPTPQPMLWRRRPRRIHEAQLPPLLAVFLQIAIARRTLMLQMSIPAERTQCDCQQQDHEPGNAHCEADDDFRLGAEMVRGVAGGTGEAGGRVARKSGIAGGGVLPGSLRESRGCCCAVQWDVGGDL